MQSGKVLKILITVAFNFIYPRKMGDPNAILVKKESELCGNVKSLYLHSIWKGGERRNRMFNCSLWHRFNPVLLSSCTVGLAPFPT